ncbi:MAG: alkaline phosphatase family protein [Cytophagales bacterium]|nr:alkaline phosphatase family protein [Cytophagales bacterium]
MNRLTTTLLLFLWLAACKPTAQNLQEESGNSDWAVNQTYVVMVSIDGFRYDYAEKFGAENILTIAENGASTSRMIPSYPSKTFPNHYTLVTGMYPGTHGITSNEFYSVSKKAHYGVRERNTVTDGSWYGGTPLWVLAEKNQMLAASYFWVGSEADIQGVRPSYDYKYDGSVPNDVRVNQVIDWLAMPEKERPHMINLYFSLVDDAGHRFGPDSDETKEAVLSIDEQIGRLREGIKASGLPVTLVITSDHGMTPINKGISLDIDWRGAEVEFISTHIMVYHKDDGVIDAIINDLKDVDGLVLYKDENFPEEYHFNNPDRSGDLLIQVQPPVIFSRRDTITGGTHGYDPYKYQDMHTIFYIEGPTIKSNYEIAPFENIHAFPLIATILGLPIPDDIDGKLEVLEGVMEE